jgi:hypothetical protein
MRLSAPQFLTHLVRDLRDRRLLPVALLLLAALVAVPALLSRSSEPPPPLSPTATTLPEGAAQAQPAVLAEKVGIRDYRKRLEALKSTNPFKQRFEPPDVSDQTLDAAASLAGSSSGGAGTGSTSSGGGEASAGGDTQADSQSDTTTVPPPEPEIRFFTRRVDVKVGPAGDLKKREDVRTLTVLPSKQKPVASYLGTNERGDQAVFLVSGDVTAVETDARCMPSSADCQFLVLEDGEEARLDYGPDGKTYVLRLLAINSVAVSGGASTPDKGKSHRPPLAG